MNPASRAAVDTASFRDRDARVYRVDDRLIRGVSDRALANFERLESTDFYRQYLEEGALVETWRLPEHEAPLPESVRARWAGFLEHRPLSVVTYPYEWTFGMLKDAAALQLDLLEAALGEGMTLKDASPYNFAFHGGRFVFFDIPSFERLEPGAPWAGYRQFCELFLYPLMLQSYKGIDFQPWLRAEIDGIAPRVAARLFGFRDRFRAGVFSHVWLQSKLDRRFGGADINVRKELASAGFSEEMIRVNVRKIRKLVQRLEWSSAGTQWAGYEAFHNYSADDRQAKESFVERCTSAAGAERIWDLGCNAGHFSKIAARHARQVLAMDLDHLAVERLYRDISRDRSHPIIPLVQNLANPSPCWGWRNRERTDLRTRAHPDLVLCLALVHHMVITAHIPMQDFVGWLADVTDQLIIEYVSRSDEKVQLLLRNKAEAYADYSRARFEQALSDSYRIEERQALPSGNRFLYWCRRA